MFLFSYNLYNESDIQRQLDEFVVSKVCLMYASLCIQRINLPPPSVVYCTGKCEKHARRKQALSYIL